jgi:hypothetical protein
VVEYTTPPPFGDGVAPNLRELAFDSGGGEIGRAGRANVRCAPKAVVPGRLAAARMQTFGQVRRLSAQMSAKGGKLTFGGQARSSGSSSVEGGCCSVNQE